MTTDAHPLTTLDWSAIAAYAAVLVVSGWLLSRRRQHSTDDYFLAGRSMPMWAVSISILATSLSAATFIGGPEQAFRGDLTYLSATIGGILGAIIVAVLFIPAYYRHRVGTVYELLEVRYGGPSRRAASAAFLVGRVFASGARIYIGALPVALIMFGDAEPPSVMTAVGALTVVGVVYTLAGGVRSVIFSDVLQTVVFVVAAVAAVVVLLNRIPAPIGAIVDTLRTAGADGTSKLRVLDLGLDPARPYTLFTAVFGFTLLNVAAYGTDQDLAQRMLTCRSAVRGSASVIVATVVGLPVTLLFMVIGLLLFVFYRCPDLMGAAAPDVAVDDTRQVFLTFILHEMPSGLAGLMVAGLFAAALSSLNSALNAMASSIVGDWRRSDAPPSSVARGRVIVALCGVVLGGFAAACVTLQQASGASLIDFALSVMTFAYSGLAAVYLVAVLSRRGSAWSAIAALIAGALVTVTLDPALRRLWWPTAWPDVVIAFPWRLVIATTVAAAVCLVGTTPGDRRA